MPFLFIYILKLSVSLAVVFLFYHFVLRKLTFYNWNRWYLLGYSLLSFFIPFINISKVLQQNEWSENSIVQWVPVINSSVEINTTTPSYSMSIWSIMSLLIITGMFIMLFRLLVQYISFRIMMKKAQFISGEGMKLYQVDENIIPFSFGNSIFINRHLHTEDDLQEIIRHEFVHVKQRHSLDILCGELLCLLNWYNPFAWLLRRSIRHNLEFIADNKVLENGISRKEYQYLLLKVIGNNHISIAPKFNFSSLQKRIAMMNKMKSDGVHIVKFLFILPLVAVLLVAFRNSYGDKQQLQNTQPPAKPGIRTTIFTDTVPAVTTLNSKGYFIDIVGNNGDCLVVIKDKDGKQVDKVLLTRWKAEAKTFEAKYGEILMPPPPPPAPVEEVSGVTPATPPVPPLPPASPDCPVKTTDATTPVAASNGERINLNGISNEYEITDKKAVIKLKNGTVEKYDLINQQERSAFEKKYGKIVNVATTVNSNVNTNVNTNVATTINSNVNANVNADVRTNVNANVNTTIRAVVAPQAISASPITIASPKSLLNNTSATPVALVTNLSGTQAIATTAPRPASLMTVAGDYSYIITGKEDIIITITKNTTRQELEAFKKQMKEKGVDLDFDEIEYNDKGVLVSLNGTMKSGDSNSNFVATDFNKLILAIIKKGDRTYFKVSVRDNKEVI